MFEKIYFKKLLTDKTKPRETFPQRTRLTNTDVDKVLKNKIRMKSSLRKNRGKTNERPKKNVLRMGSGNIAHINMCVCGGA